MIKERIEIPKRGLHDIFVDIMARAMKTTPEEAKTIFNL